MKHNDDKLPGVYFIYAPNQNKIKIGRSIHIDTRYNQLKTGFMDEGILVAGIITEKEKELEKFLHGKFSHLRDNGEWFIRTQDLDEFINDIEINYKTGILFKESRILQNKMVFTKRNTFETYSDYLKVFNKYFPIIILAILGIITGINQSYIFSKKEFDNSFQIFNYLVLFLYPFLIPIIGYKIIQLESPKTLKIFVSSCIIAYSIEIVNIVYPLNETLLILLRVIIASVFYSLGKYILSISLREDTQKIVKTSIKQKFSNIYDSDSLEKEISVILLKKQEFGEKLARIILVFFAVYWLAINAIYFFSNNKIAMIMSFNVISFFFVYLYKIEDYNSITKKLTSLFFLLFFISPFLLSIVLQENDFTKNAISFMFSISLLSIMVIAFIKVFINHKFDSQVDVLKEKINLIRK